MYVHVCIRTSLIWLFGVEWTCSYFELFLLCFEAVFYVLVLFDPDMTYEIDWKFKINYLPIYQYVCICTCSPLTGTHFQTE